MALRLFTKKSIAVSALAHYAANPKGHCRQKGKADNKAAARYGDRAHLKAGYSPFHLVQRLIRITLVLLIIGVALWWGGVV